MASYQYKGGQTGSSSSTDPYQQFYYWDVTANNWAFDYDSYYATYGHPQAGGYDPSYAAEASTQASAYGGAPMTGAFPGATDVYGAPQEKKKRAGPGPKDEEGNPIAGKLKPGQTRETVLRKRVGKVYEDQTLLEWDPCKCDELRSDVAD